MRATNELRGEGGGLEKSVYAHTTLGFEPLGSRDVMLAMSGPVSIGDLMRDHRLLWVYCRNCGRERHVDPATLPLPGEYPVPDVGKRMRCTACGSRKVHTAPELYPGGIEAMRARWGGKQPCARP